MKLTWHGQSCFTLETAQGTLVFDPYEDHYIPGLSPLSLSADQVLCTHGHKDHSAAHLVKLTGTAPTFTVEGLDTFHDPEQGKLRGPNRMYLVSTEGMRLAHVGDLGCRPSDEQMAKLQGVDVLLIPVGGHYTIDAAQAQALAEELQPRIVVPMHYRSDTFSYEVLATVEDFLALRHDVVRYDTDTLEVTKDTPAQTAVLRYLG